MDNNWDENAVPPTGKSLMMSTPIRSTTGPPPPSFSAAMETEDDSAAAMYAVPPPPKRQLAFSPIGNSSSAAIAASAQQSKPSPTTTVSCLPQKRSHADADHSPHRSGAPVPPSMETTKALSPHGLSAHSVVGAGATSPRRAGPPLGRGLPSSPLSGPLPMATPVVVEEAEPKSPTHIMPTDQPASPLPTPTSDVVPETPIPVQRGTYSFATPDFMTGAPPPGRGLAMSPVIASDLTHAIPPAGRGLALSPACSDLVNAIPPVGRGLAMSPAPPPKPSDLAHAIPPQGRSLAVSPLPRVKKPDLAHAVPSQGHALAVSPVPSGLAHEIPAAGCGLAISPSPPETSDLLHAIPPPGRGLDVSPPLLGQPDLEHAIPPVGRGLAKSPARSDLAYSVSPSGRGLATSPPPPVSSDMVHAIPPQGRSLAISPIASNLTHAVPPAGRGLAMSPVRSDLEYAIPSVGRGLAMSPLPTGPASAPFPPSSPSVMTTSIGHETPLAMNEPIGDPGPSSLLEFSAVGNAESPLVHGTPERTSAVAHDADLEHLIPPPGRGLQLSPAAGGSTTAPLPSVPLFAFHHARSSMAPESPLAPILASPATKPIAAASAPHLVSRPKFTAGPSSSTTLTATPSRTSILGGSFAMAALVTAPATTTGPLGKALPVSETLNAVAPLSPTLASIAPALEQQPQRHRQSLVPQKRSTSADHTPHRVRAPHVPADSMVSPASSVVVAESNDADVLPAAIEPFPVTTTTPAAVAETPAKRDPLGLRLRVPPAAASPQAPAFFSPVSTALKRTMSQSTSSSVVVDASPSRTAVVMVPSMADAQVNTDEPWPTAPVPAPVAEHDVAQRDTMAAAQAQTEEHYLRLLADRDAQIAALSANRDQLELDHAEMFSLIQDADGKLGQLEGERQALTDALAHAKAQQELAEQTAARVQGERAGVQDAAESKYAQLETEYMRVRVKLQDVTEERDDLLRKTVDDSVTLASMLADLKQSEAQAVEVREYARKRLDAAAAEVAKCHYTYKRQVGALQARLDLAESQKREADARSGAAVARAAELEKIAEELLAVADGQVTSSEQKWAEYLAASVPLPPAGMGDDEDEDLL
ncbi:hypothetical protein BC828DRAFT_390393 [Blastocladiella britannica]|nr:hypothetical protein BC828DRAFT_390393 [Blastocladiella britannica]